MKIDDDDDNDDDDDDDDKAQLKVHINLPRMSSIQRGTGFQCTSNKWKDIDDWNWNCKKICCFKLIAWMYRSWIVKPLYGAWECPNRASWVYFVYAWVYFVCQIWIWNWRWWAIEHIFPDLNPNLAWVHISIWNWSEHTYIHRLESKISWSLPNMDYEQFFI